MLELSKQQETAAFHQSREMIMMREWKHNYNCFVKGKNNNHDKYSLLQCNKRNTSYV